MEVFERSEGRFRVQSESDKTVWYHVKRIGKDGWGCSCDGSALYGRICKHIKAVGGK